MLQSSLFVDSTTGVNKIGFQKGGKGFGKAATSRVLGNSRIKRQKQMDQHEQRDFPSS